MAKQWRVAPTVPAEWRSRWPELSPAVAQLLYNRGITTPEAVDEFLSPDYEHHIHDPFLFRDMTKAVERIFAAIAAGEKIIVHGDYDADGVTSSAVMMTALQKLQEHFGPKGIDPKQLDIFIPHREKEGYGLRPETVDYFVEQQAKLVITVDCGVASVAEVALCNQRGIDVIITDHHQQLLEVPAAVAIINPAVDGETYPFRGLSGVGVAFKVVQALFRHAKQQQPEESWEGYEKWLLDLVAIGTVADVMPLLGENRTLVKYGLVVLNKTPRVGLKALLFKAGIEGNGNGNRDLLPKRGLNSYSIAFQIAPRINAAGRMDHANTAYRLLMTADPAEAETLSDEIQQSNVNRQLLTDTIVAEAKRMLDADRDTPLLAVVGENWPIGVLGLVASRLAEQSGKPVIVGTVAAGTIAASGRSGPNFDLTIPLKELEGYFSRYGGHRAAGGFALKDINDWAVVKQKFIASAAAATATGTATPILEIDAVMTLEQADWALVDDLEKFEPFGEKNGRPRFGLQRVPVEGVEPLGRDGRHLKLLLKQANGVVRKLVAFGSTADFHHLKRGDLVDVVVELGINEWNGNRELQLKVVDVRQSTD